MRRARSLAALACLVFVGTPADYVAAQQQGLTQAGVIDLTVERMVQLTLSNSFQVRLLNMSVEQTRLGLRAERAGLRSSVSLTVSAPDFSSVSQSRYNSVLGRNEIVSENSRRWEAQLSVRQPVIAFGYPTNGYLSLNNRMYRYTQIDDDGSSDLTYYNRYFVQYTQPLFQPNSLKNSLEQAELNFEDAEIDYYGDVMSIINSTTNNYFSLFETAYEQVIANSYIARLEQAAATAQSLAATTPSRAIEVNQMNVELANAREQLQRLTSEFRLDTEQLKTSLNLAPTDNLTLTPDLTVQPVSVDIDRATQFALGLTPRLRQIDITYRESQIRLEETKARNAFRVDLAFTYGREMREEVFDQLWADPRNTYTVDVRAFIPIWDWGQRDARIQSSQITLDRNRLQREQAEIQIVSNVRNEVLNVQELQARALTMQNNLTLASEISEESLELYAQGNIAVVELLQSLRREQDTHENLLDAYLGWRRSLQRLQQQTYYDFEFDMPVLSRYGVMQ
jgi:outer membrane protein TolC